MGSRIAIFNMQDGIPMKRRKYPEIWYWDNERKTIMIKYPTGHTDEKLFAMNDQDHIDYNDSAQKTPAVRKNARGSITYLRLYMQLTGIQQMKQIVRNWEHSTSQDHFLLTMLFLHSKTVAK